MAEKKAPKKKAATKAATKAAPKKEAPTPGGMDALMVKLGDVSARNRAVIEGLHRQKESPLKVANRLGITPRALDINHTAALINLINLLTNNGLKDWATQAQRDSTPADGASGGGAND